jgi:phage RecT family recombinase
MAPRQSGERGQTVRAAVAERNGGPGKDLATKTDDPLRDLVRQMEGEIAKQLPSHIPSDYFTRMALTGLRRNDALAQLHRTSHGRASLLAALLEAARFGLMPFTDEAAIVAFRNEATFIPMYKGLITLMYQTGQVSGVEARLIHQHDTWSLAYGDGGGFYHRPLLVNEDGTPAGPEQRGPAILAYCYVRLKDGERTSVVTLTRAEAEEIRDKHSRSYQNAEKSWNNQPPKRDSPWHLEFDKMWIKSAIRRADAPKSPRLVEVLTAAARDDIHGPPGAVPPTLGDLGVDGDVLEGEVLSDTADPGEPQDTAQGAAPAADPAADRARRMRRLQALLGELRLPSGRRAERLAVCRWLARDDGEDQPVALGSSSDLTDDQLGRVTGKLAAIAAGIGEDEPAEQVLDAMLGLARAGGWQEAAS